MVISMDIKQKIEDSLLSGPEALVDVAKFGFSEKSEGFSDVRDTLLSSAYPHKLEAEKLPSEKFMPLVILLLAYSAIDPNLIETPVFRKYQDTVFQACEELDIDANLIAPVSTIELSLYQILERV